MNYSKRSFIGTFIAAVAGILGACLIKPERDPVWLRETYQKNFSNGLIPVSEVHPVGKVEDGWMLIRRDWKRIGRSNTFQVTDEWQAVSSKNHPAWLTGIDIQDVVTTATAT